MNGDYHHVTGKILAAIDYGQLPKAETERRVLALVEAEISRTDAPPDVKLLEACESLLLELATDSTVKQESHLKANWQAIQVRLATAERQRRFRKMVIRSCVAVAAVVVLVIGASDLLNFQWLEMYSSSDEQQYVLQGHEVDVSLVQKAIAEHGGMHEFSTRSAEELITFLGFDPGNFIDAMPPWKAKSHYAVIYPNRIQITVDA